jgi:deoxyribodipyrimidine photo-lyase
MNKRTRQLKEGAVNKGPVIYWMSRDQRIHDNWALLTSLQYAHERKQPLVIIFNLADKFLSAGSRQFRFMIRGLKDVFNTASEYNIPFYLLRGEAGETVPEFIKSVSASVLFTDFDPLRIKKNWLSEVLNKVDIPVFQTDAHNIVTAFRASVKQEFSAAHFRRKISPLLPEYLEEYPSLLKLEKNELSRSAQAPAFEKLLSEFNDPPFEVDWMKPGQNEGYKALESFIETRLNRYKLKNDPNSMAVSDLSPYLHFGHLSAQRVALNLDKIDIDPESKASFLDELIVRKELSDNFCLYNTSYDCFDGFPSWGKETLNKHRDDEREFVYTFSEFESAKTHDALWNAAQIEMITRGKMHGYMRMYWCKKILEWSESPEEALRISIELNDKYELDGRDPNGYAGIAWSIGGLHDRPFAERPVYGRIRYMNYNGCKRKFDVNKYIEKNSVFSGLFE